MAQKIISDIKVKPITYGHLEGGNLYLMVFASNAKYQSIVSKETKSYFDGNQVKMYHLNRVAFNDCIRDRNDLFSKKELEIQFDGIDLEVAEKSGLISFREVIDIQEVTIEPIPGIIF